MRTWLVLAALLAVGVAARPALTAGGGGAAAVSGYRVSDVRYALEGDRIAAVSFSLDRPARTVRARLSPGEAWSSCSGSETRFSCKTATSSGAADALDVVAAG